MYSVCNSNNINTKKKKRFWLNGKSGSIYFYERDYLKLLIWTSDILKEIVELSETFFY